MNVGTITTLGGKGQIVIPKEYRDSLGISPGAQLNVRLRGDGISVEPVSVEPLRNDDDTAFLELLKKYRGIWGPETAEEKKRRIANKKFEIAAARKRRNAW